MAILIDPPHTPGHGRDWSHLVSDTSIDELHEFARRHGLPARGFDGDHYDVPAELYDRMLESGAIPVSNKELVARLAAAGLRRRRSATLRAPAGEPAHLAARAPARRHRRRGRAGRADSP
ncbi:MAG: DUF4031 domain-containing protein [Nocardioides sp.]